jgi:TldD protein
MVVDMTMAQKKLKNIKAEYAEIRMSESDTVSIHLSKNRVETCKAGKTTQGSVRVYNRGCWGFVSFTTLDMIDYAIIRAQELSHIQKKDDAVSIAAMQSNVVNKKTKVLKPLHSVSLEEKMELMHRYNAILKSSPLVENTNVVYRDSMTHYYMYNTDETGVDYESSFCGVSFSAIAKDGTVMQPYGESIAQYGGFELVEDNHAVAEEVVKTAAELVKAEQVQSGLYNVIVDPKLAGVFIHEAFGHLSEADFIYENPRMKELMVIGRRFGPECLQVIDDGSLPYTGYIPIDDEGIQPQKTYLIKDGILTGRLHSRETAKKMGEQPTGNARAISCGAPPIVRMTNTYIDNGTATADELFDRLGNGLYVAGALGGQTNLEMFTFTPAYAYEVKRGKKTRLLRDCMLSGNVFMTLMNIDSIADDCTMFGGLGGCGKQGQAPLPVSSGGPHLLIKNVLIGGSGAGGSKKKS